MLQAPEDVLRAVTTDAEIDSPRGAQYLSQASLPFPLHPAVMESPRKTNGAFPNLEIFH
ncbi:MAG: hypothetical protein R3F31_09035 [Verrucomicrobiales bacterium]